MRYGDYIKQNIAPYPAFVEGIRRAPDRGFTLTPAQTATALKNALRYVPKNCTRHLPPNFWKNSARAGVSTAIATVLKATSKRSPSTNTKEIASKAKPSR